MDFESFILNQPSAGVCVCELEPELAFVLERALCRESGRHLGLRQNEN